MTSINTGGAGTRGQPISFFSVFALIIICFLQKKKEKAHPPVAQMLSALHCIAVHSQAIKKKNLFNVFRSGGKQRQPDCSPCRTGRDIQTEAWVSLQNWVLRVYGVQKCPSTVTLTCTQTSSQRFLKQERETTLHTSDDCSYWLSKCFSLQLKKRRKKTLYSLQLILVCAFLIILWSVWGLSLVLSYTGVAKKIKFKIFCTPPSTQYFVVLLCHLQSTNNHFNPPFTNEDEKKSYRNHW